MKGSNYLPVYDAAEAAYFVWERLDAEKKSRFSPEEVYQILSLEVDYLESENLVKEEPGIFSIPVTVDWEKLTRHILLSAQFDGIDLEDQDIEAILEGENDYLESIGMLVDDESYQAFYN
jgi:hypothetical protein